MSTKNYHQYTEVSYSGRKLLEQHSLSEEGFWQIRGEDSNADLHGSHYMPDLGIVEGRLQDVIEYAVELPDFWQWGGGGSITKIGTIPKINKQTNMERANLLKEQQDLEAQLKSVQKRLKEI